MTDENNISKSGRDTGPGRLIRSKKEVTTRQFFLKGKTIAISISESENLNELGYGVIHVKDAMIEIARYILALGGKLAYGGDMRRNGFTELLFDLLAYYKADKKLHPNERFYSYLSWPLSLNLTKKKQAALIHNVTFAKVEPPDDIKINDLEKFLPPDSPANLYIWARCLTKMRNQMEENCDARVFIGGRTIGYKSKCPGILEELLVALDFEHPVYLVGAFGGITKDAITAIDGNMPKSFTEEYQFKNEGYKTFYSYFNNKHKKDGIDYKEYFNRLKKLGFKGLAELNGLSETDNRRLTTTPHIDEIVYLILKGLTNKFAK